LESSKDRGDRRKSRSASISRAGPFGDDTLDIVGFLVKNIPFEKPLEGDVNPS
jgi:hypothetical protein